MATPDAWLNTRSVVLIRELGSHRGDSWRGRGQSLGCGSNKLLDRQSRSVADLGEPAEDSPRQDYRHFRSNEQAVGR